MDRETGIISLPHSGASSAESSADELLRKLNQVQNLVADALSCTNGACAGAAAAAVDSSVRRARTKARMLPSMGTDLVLAALDEVAWEIASMPEASVANATLMRRLTEEGVPTEEAAAPQGPGPAQVAGTPTAASQRGEPPSDIRVESFADEKRSSVAPGSPQRAGDSDISGHGAPSSVLSVLRTGSHSGAEEDLESTAGTSEAGAAAADTAARLMDPLRRLAAEASGADEAAALRRTLRLKKPKSGDLKLARELDFDECASPRAGSSPPAAARGAPPRIRGACLEFGVGPEGDAQKVEPMYPEMDQFSPMGPRTPQHGRGVGWDASGGGGGRGTGKILTLKGEQPPRPSRISPRPIPTRQVSMGGSPGSPGSPHRAWHALGALRSRSVSASPPTSPSAHAGGLGMGAAAAEAGMPPPGMLPTARVEGRGAAGGEVIGSSPSGAEERGEVTETEMGELCTQLAGGLGV